MAISPPWRFYQGGDVATLMRFQNIDVAIDWCNPRDLGSARCWVLGAAPAMEAADEFVHDGEQCRAGEALLRAFARPALAASQAQTLASSEARLSAASLLAASVQQLRSVKRHRDTLVWRQTLGREYMASRRM